MRASLASFRTGVAGNVFCVDYLIVSFVELPLIEAVYTGGGRGNTKETRRSQRTEICS